MVGLEAGLADDGLPEIWPRLRFLTTRVGFSPAAIACRFPRAEFEGALSDVEPRSAFAAGCCGIACAGAVRGVGRVT